MERITWILTFFQHEALSFALSMSIFSCQSRSVLDAGTGSLNKTQGMPHQVRHDSCEAFPIPPNPSVKNWEES
jgi:hypothetical protein